MKKIIRNSVALFTLSALFLVSCSEGANSDDNTGTPTSSFQADPTNLKGTITDGVVVLDANVEYKLTGGLVVEKGAKLVIPAGTKIVGTGGTSAYIAVAQGGKIDVQGTASKPVVMTGAEQTPGNWGGLVICGKAPINSGSTATAEVSELTYGGDNPSDNSGSIKYLRIEYAGANFNSEKEFNGLSLFGVGNGTTIEYVQMYKGSDDGIEFFGGTVNTKYIISSYNEDDQFDWTEGYSGTNENWYGVRVAGVSDKGMECDNNAQNHLAQPISSPTIKNVTLIGSSNADDVQAIKLRVGTYVKLDNVVLKDWKTGFDIQHDETIAAIAAGSLKATNVKFENVTSKSKGKNSAGETVDVSNAYTEKASATGAGNGAAVPSWAQGWTVGL